MQASTNVGAGELRVGDRITFPRLDGSPVISASTGREVIAPPQPVGTGLVAVRTRDGHGEERTETFARSAGLLVSR